MVVRERMGEPRETKRAAAICTHCGSVQSVRIGSNGDVKPIGTGLGTDCTCGNSDFRVLSEDDGVLADVGSSKYP